MCGALTVVTRAQRWKRAFAQRLNGRPFGRETADFRRLNSVVNHDSVFFRQGPIASSTGCVHRLPDEGTMKVCDHVRSVTGNRAGSNRGNEITHDLIESLRLFDGDTVTAFFEQFESAIGDQFRYPLDGFDAPPLLVRTCAH